MLMPFVRYHVMHDLIIRRNEQRIKALNLFLAELWTCYGSSVYRET
jgi:hypothetical protein